MLLRIVALVSFVLSVNCADLSKDLEGYTLNHVKVLNAETFADFTNVSNTRVIFFYEKYDMSMTDPDEADSDDDDVSFVDVKVFLPKFEKAAEYLANKYSILVGLVDCESINIKERCGQAKLNNIYLFGYKHGKQVIKLTFQNLNDEAALIGSALHLNTLRKIPIINSFERVEKKIMEPSKGKNDVFFAYFQYLGDEIYRNFVEATYSYQTEFKYIMLTKKETFEKLSFYETLKKAETSKIYFFKCSTTKEGEPCPHTVYRGGLEKENITAFMRNVLEVQKVVDLPNDGNIDDYKHIQAHKAYFLYDDKSKDTVRDAADGVFAKFPGSFLVYMLDTGKLKIKDIIGRDKKAIRIPSMAVKYTSDERMYFLPSHMTADGAVKFINKKLKEIKGTKMVETFKDPVQVFDDEVASPVYHLSLLPQSQFNISHIEALNVNTFKVKTERDTPTLVLFYTTYDPPSMALLRSLAIASKPLADSQEMTSLTRVNCFDWTDVCVAQNVHKFPTIIVYQKDVKPKVYKGMLDGEAIINHRRIVQLGSPIEITCPKKAEAFIAGEYPAMDKENIDGAVIAGLSSNKDITNFKEVAEFFDGEMVFAYGTMEVANTICSKAAGAKEEPCVFLLVPNHPMQVVQLNEGKLNVEHLKDDIASRRLPTLIELTVINFPKFYKQKSLLVVYFGAKSEKECKSLSKVADTGKYPVYKFVWVDVSAIDSIGHEILHTYSSDVVLPTIAVINIEKGTVHLFDKDMFSQAAIEDWLMRVATEKQMPTYIMPDSEWKPLNEGYDFIALAANRTDEDAGHGGRLRGGTQAEDDKDGDDEDKPDLKMDPSQAKMDAPMLSARKMSKHEEL